MNPKYALAFPALILLVYVVYGYLQDHTLIAGSNRDLGLLFGLTGALLLAWGIYGGHAPHIVPGCLLLGLGVVILLYAEPKAPALPRHQLAAAALAMMAASFLAIPYLTATFTDRRLLWPVVPALLLAATAVLAFLQFPLRRLLGW